MNAPDALARRKAAAAAARACRAGGTGIDAAPAVPAAAVPPLHHTALAALAAGLPADTEGTEADWLRALVSALPRPAAPGGPADSPLAVAAALARQWSAQPPAVDAGLHAIVTALGLGPAEAVATALALAVEFDPMVGRALAWLQAPVGGARPTLGLLASLGPLLGWLPGAAPNQAAAAVLAALSHGPARASGLWLIDGETRPLPEQALQLPLPLALAMRAHAPSPRSGAVASGDAVGARGTPHASVGLAAAAGTAGTAAAASTAAAAATAAMAAPAGRWPLPVPWPGLHWLDSPAPQPPSLQRAVHDQAAALAAAGPGGVLVVRSGHPREARAAAAAVAAALSYRAIAVDGSPPAGLGPWLGLHAALPVLLVELAPGESLRLPRWPGWAGPLLVAAGVDGQVQADGDPVAEWAVPLPLPAERAALWAARLPADAAQRVGLRHRHSVAQIEQLERSARHLARLDAGSAPPPGAAEPALTEAQVHRATRQGSPGGLGSLAQWLPDPVPDEALVVSPALRIALAALCSRCERRDGLADPLGPAARTRYRPGVRALLVGPSGTGKTLAVGWLASRLGLPLYRVDLAAVASKYIGETEKNLAQLFARAEQAEGVLLFDEADALFGKRTEVKDANDRFANQQTNYLLQRIESFDGITVLTSNSRARFDSAFTRRLDAIIDFPAPGPQERRALWQAHLGDHHGLDDAQLNRIAAGCDLAGGHIRNATFAAVAAVAGPVAYADLRSAIEAEYRKLGRQPPSGL